MPPSHRHERSDRKVLLQQSTQLMSHKLLSATAALGSSSLVAVVGCSWSPGVQCLAVGAAAASAAARLLRNTIKDRAGLSINNWLRLLMILLAQAFACGSCRVPQHTNTHMLQFFSSMSRQTPHHHHVPCHPLTWSKNNQDAHLNPQGSH